MNTSRLYRIHQDTKTLQGVTEIDFSGHRFRERYDIQEWLESTPEIFGEALLVIAKEQSCFEGTRERPDLVALDKEGNLVIIELKRDDSGSTVEWQAIKYASYYSRFNSEKIVNTYWEYLKSSADNQDVELAEAQGGIAEFTGEASLDSLNAKQRIILVSHRFAREVISAVYWLIDKYDMEIKCLQLIPYFDADKDSYYLQASAILPVPGVDDVLVGPSSIQPTSRRYGPVRKDDEVTAFCARCVEELAKQISSDCMPNKQSRWAGTCGGYRYFHLWYDQSIWDNNELKYAIWYYPADATEKETREKVYVGLQSNERYLLGKNCTEKQVAALAEFLDKFMPDSFSFERDKSYFWTSKEIDAKSLSEQQIKATAAALKTLVEGSKAEVERILAA